MVMETRHTGTACPREAVEPGLRSECEYGCTQTTETVRVDSCEKLVSGVWCECLSAPHSHTRVRARVCGCGVGVGCRSLDLVSDSGH
jgi:hypothetical protein